MRGAVVTGAGRGLGLEISRALGRGGFAVHLTDIDKNAAAAGAEEIGAGAWASALDVRDADACRATARATVERAGSLDVWVNNAGLLVTGVTWEHDEATRRALLDVNALGTMNGTVAALEAMRASGSGHVVNIVSLAGLIAAPGEALYAATKHAAIAFSLGALADLRRSGIKGVHVSAVCPDGIWTPMLHDKLDDPDAAGSFSGKLLSAEEVAAKVIELLDRPRPVLTIPRYRGIVVRMLDIWPGLMIHLLPLLFADARRRQRAWKRRIEAGEAP